MTIDLEVTDWVEWTGGENPVPGQRVEVRWGDGHPATTMTSDNGDWQARHGEYIIAYRVVSPTPASAALPPRRLAGGGWPSRGVWGPVRNLFVQYAEKFVNATRYEEASAIADHAAREIEALFPPVVGWRPIDQDTPRDGRLMWLGRPYSLRVGFWATGEKYEHKGTVGGGWRDLNEGRDLAFEPTHWQPVPDAPPALPAAPLTTDETQP